jgi:hypothetical protein
MRCTAILVAGFLAATSVAAFAHEEFRLVGVVTKVGQGSFGVKPQGKPELAVKHDRQTAIMRDGKKIGMMNVKPGETAVVDALGDSMEDMLAIEVRIVPPVK